jgi:hypothetical protein
MFFFCKDDGQGQMLIGECDYVDILHTGKQWAQFISPKKLMMYDEYSPGLEILKGLSNFPVETWPYANVMKCETYRAAARKLYEVIATGLALSLKQNQWRRWIRFAFEERLSGLMFAFLERDADAIFTLLRRTE